MTWECKSDFSGTNFYKLGWADGTTYIPTPTPHENNVCKFWVTADPFTLNTTPLQRNWTCNGINGWEAISCIAPIWYCGDGKIDTYNIDGTLLTEECEFTANWSWPSWKICIPKLCKYIDSNTQDQLYKKLVEISWNKATYEIYGIFDNYKSTGRDIIDDVSWTNISEINIINLISTSATWWLVSTWATWFVYHLTWLDIGSGISFSLIYDVIYDTSFNNDYICNQAQVSLSGINKSIVSDDPYTDIDIDATCSGEISVTPIVDLSINKTISVSWSSYNKSGTTTSWSLISWRLDYSNYSNIACTDVIITDILPTDQTLYTDDGLELI